MSRRSCRPIYYVADFLCRLGIKEANGPEARADVRDHSRAWHRIERGVATAYRATGAFPTDRRSGARARGEALRPRRAPSRAHFGRRAIAERLPRTPQL